MTIRLPIVAALLFAGAAQAQAQTVPMPGSSSSGAGAGEVISLSPAEKEAALNAAAQRNLNQTSLFAAPLPPPGTVIHNDGKPHGSMEMMVGSDGSRGIAGTTYMPLGNGGSRYRSASQPDAYGYAMAMRRPIAMRPPMAWPAVAIPDSASDSTSRRSDRKAKLTPPQRGATSARMSKQHLYLVDGSGYIFRAYHRLPPLTDPCGTPVGAVYGFTAMLWKLIEELNAAEAPTHLAVILDAGAHTFRNDLYPAYKANRPPAPEDLIPQFPLIRDAVRAFSVPWHRSGGRLEADDIIAS